MAASARRRGPRGRADASSNRISSTPRLLPAVPPARLCIICPPVPAVAGSTLVLRFGANRRSARPHRPWRVERRARDVDVVAQVPRSCRRGGQRCLPGERLRRATRVTAPIIPCRGGIGIQPLPLCWPLASCIGQTAQHDSQANRAHSTRLTVNGDRAACDGLCWPLGSSGPVRALAMLDMRPYSQTWAVGARAFGADGAASAPSASMRRCQRPWRRQRR